MLNVVAMVMDATIVHVAHFPIQKMVVLVTIFVVAVVVVVAAAAAATKLLEQIVYQLNLLVLLVPIKIRLNSTFVRYKVQRGNHFYVVPYT